MVKGVSRQIIEISNPDSEYFERALLYLKAGQTLPQRELARLAADEYVLSMETRGGQPDGTDGASEEIRVKRLSKRVKILAALTAFFAAASAGATALLIVYTKM